MFGPTMTDDECVALCNEVAWQHRADGWGLSAKTSGTRGRRYDGQECAHDILVDAQGIEYDILTAAGAASTPTWGKSGGKARPGREWVAPIQPQGAVTPGPVPPPVPTPTPVPTKCAFVPADLGPVNLQLTTLFAGLAELTRLVGDLTGRVDALSTQATDLTTATLTKIDEAQRHLTTVLEGLPAKLPAANAKCNFPRFGK